MDWMLDAPLRWLVPLLLVCAGVGLSVRLSRGRIRAQREGLRQQLSQLHGEQAAVATALGGQLRAHRRFGGEADPDGVGLDRSGLLVWLPDAGADPARIRTWIDRIVAVAQGLLLAR